MTATTEVVISVKSKLEFLSSELSGIAVSRMSRMRMCASCLTTSLPVLGPLRLFQMRALLRLDACFLDHLGPQREFRPDHMDELIGRVADHVHAKITEFGGDLRHGEHLGRFL